MPGADAEPGIVAAAYDSRAAANMTMAEALGLALASPDRELAPPGLLCAQGCVSAGVGAGSD